MKISGIFMAALAMLFTLGSSACATPAPESPADVIENSLASVVQVIKYSGSGTGFIVSEDGLVVTNKHVVRGQQSVTIRLATGEEYRGNITQRHSTLDLAYVEIDSKRAFAPLSLGDSDEVRISESVIAIGYPLGDELGLEPTVSLGIISAKRDDYLQTDASLNPGNSGGPLLDSKGQVIGVITTRIESTETGRPVTGIGFAIPINAVREDVSGLVVAAKASQNPTLTPLPTVSPTPNAEATKIAIEAMEARLRVAEQATRAATEARVEQATRAATKARQEAERYAASLRATRVAEFLRPTVAPRPAPTARLFPTAKPFPTATPLPVPSPTPTAVLQATGRNYFTRGSSQDEVLLVQGTPDEINTYRATGIEIWSYGWSTVTFSLPDGLVAEWRNDGNLKVELIPNDNASMPGYFTRASSQDEVLLVQGTPDEINTYRATGIEKWSYGRSTVTFSLPDGLVAEWRNDGNLKVELIPSENATPAHGYFTRRSSQDEVLLVQGTPDEINTYRATGIEIWSYGWSTVTFSLPNGLVAEWRNEGNLKVE